MNRLLHIASAFLAAALISACSSEGISQRPPTNNGGQDNIVLRENGFWTLSYGGRSEIIENGVAADVENFTMRSNDNSTYFMDIISAYNLENGYDNSLVDYFKDELQTIASWAAQDNCSISDYLYSGNQTFQFDRMRSGDWIAVSFGISNGKLTGDYTLLKFTIKEESPEENYLKWLGTWEITDGKTAYNLTLKQSEANFAITVSGWETGFGGNSDAKNYSFETYYDRWTGSMVFLSQAFTWFKGTDGHFYDVCLLGNFYYPGGASLAEGSYVLTDDLNIAEAIMRPDGRFADVTACRVNVQISEDEFYETSFTSMQYYDVSDYDLFTYNEIVPQFPLTMTKLSSGRAVTKSDGDSCNIRRIGSKAVRHNFREAQAAEGIRAAGSAKRR